MVIPSLVRPLVANGVELVAPAPLMSMRSFSLKVVGFFFEEFGLVLIADDGIMVLNTFECPGINVELLL